MKARPSRTTPSPPDLSRPEDRWLIDVPSASAGDRLDRYLARVLDWRTRSRIQKEIASGIILVDDRKVKPSHKIKDSEVISVTLDHTPTADQDPGRIKLDILFEDEYLIALSKQPGVVVHPVGPYRYNTLINALHLRYRSDDPARDVVPRLCHRLDKDTSGLILVAKDEHTRRLLQFQFERQLRGGLPPEAMEIEKEYFAITRGVPEPAEGSIDFPIGPDEDSLRHVKMRVTPDGLSALTDYKVIGDKENHALVKLTLHTGRTHQIRVHLSHAGWPVAGDELYGGDGEPRIIDRCALHSHRLKIYHPHLKEMMELIAPLPDDMEDAIRKLGIRK